MSRKGSPTESRKGSPTERTATMTVSTELEAVTEGAEVDLPDFTREEAEAITSRILAGANVIWGLIADAYQRRAWAVLGYETWDEYLDGEMGGAPLSLPREKRKEAVVSLRGAGLSLRAIASATGTNHQTVANDLAEVKAEASTSEPAGAVEELDSTQAARLTELLEVQSERPLGENENEELTNLEAIANGEVEIIDAEIVEEAPPSNVVGLDGKSHPAAKAEPKTPKAPPMAQCVKDAKKVAKLLQSAQELYNDILTNTDYIDASKEVKTQVAEALAAPLNDLLDEFEIKVPAKWLKLVQ
jgi:hypothetical protein